MVYLLKPLEHNTSGVLNVDIAIPPSEFVKDDQPISAADIFGFFGNVTPVV